MIDAPHVLETQTIPTAIVRLTIPVEQCMHEFGSAVSDIFAALEARGVEPNGAVFSHHLQMPSDIFDFEIGVPVTTVFVSHGRVVAGSLPAANVARTIYRGPYEGLPDAWGEFVDWIEASGYSPAATLWETYVGGPAQSEDPAHLQTELTRPLLAGYASII